MWQGEVHLDCTEVGSSPHNLNTGFSQSPKFPSDKAELTEVSYNSECQVQTRDVGKLGVANWTPLYLQSALMMLF